ncbi:MAG: hypothetical protein H0W42_11205 [Gemmatimonadaceae bacterium]|nr:hypothetical protein [Gemmatimonadaceae bacterium]
MTDAQSAAPSHDRLKLWRYELRQQGQTDLVDQREFAATSALAFSTVYDGPSLSTGNYEVRVQGTDAVGVPGAWSGWRLFTIANLGTVDVSASGPTGKLESGAYSSNWTGRWTHPTALTATKAWVRILSGGVVVRQTPAAGVTVSVANNAFISLTNTQAAVALAANPLPPGIYTWQMQAQASDGSLSAWSADVPLSVNYPPNQPSSLRPVSGTTHATLPLIDWLLSDPDLDDVLGVGLTSMVEITRPDTTQVTREVATVDPSTGRGYYQSTAADMPVNTTTIPYQVRVRGRDVSAAGQTGEYGPWSAPIALFLAAIPIVAIAAPIENAVIATSQPQIVWTVTGGTQVTSRVQLYRAGQPTPFFSSGQIAASGSAGSYLIPAGWLKPGNLYDADVTIWTAGGIVGTSPRRRFAVQYADANLVPNVTVALYQNPRDVEPVSVAVAWGQTSYPQSQFLGYVIWRRPTADAPEAATPIALIRSPGQLSWIDHHAPPNRPLVYAVTQLRRSGNDVQSSQPSEAGIEVPLETPVIASLESGGSHRFPVMFLEQSLSGGFTRDEASVETWGSGGKPTLIRPPAGYGARSFALGFTLLTYGGVGVAERMADVKAVIEAGDPVSLRTAEEVVFCRIVPRGNYWKRGAAVGMIEVTLNLEEIAWSEAVSLAG